MTPYRAPARKYEPQQWEESWLTILSGESLLLNFLAAANAVCNAGVPDATLMAELIEARDAFMRRTP